MNETLEKLVNAYIDGGTGSIMLYYDFFTTGFTTGLSSDYRATFPVTDYGWDSNLELTGTVPAFADQISLLDGGGGPYEPNLGDDPSTISGTLDPAGTLGIRVEAVAQTSLVTVKVDNTGTLTGIRQAYYNGVDWSEFNDDQFLLYPSYTGYIKNTSPSSTVGSHDGALVDFFNTDTAVQQGLVNYITGEKEGGDLTRSNIQFNDFSGEGFLSTGDLNSEFCILFSSQKLTNDNGVILGNLNRREYDDGTTSFTYGQGFNIGINDRNKLFFQGIDATIGEYVVVADKLELANKNICSVSVSPFSVRFALFNLSDDEFEEQTLRTDSKLNQNDWGQDFTIGGSPTYLRAGQTYSGYIDELLLLTGDQVSSDLKAIASGFVATGIPVSSGSFIDEQITGHEVSLVSPVGVTGYQLVPTGFEEVLINSNLIEFVLVENPTPYSRNDGERFFTGYSLDNGSGSYLEETSFLIPDDNYTTTGDNAFATLGLVDSGDVVTRYTVTSTKVVTTASGVTLYEVQPITGILLGEPTGYQKTILTTNVAKTGSLVESLQFKEGWVEDYRHDYLHYLEQRV